MRRIMIVLTATLIASTASACANVTEPTTPRTATSARREVIAVTDSTLCRSGWDSSTGRCL